MATFDIWIKKHPFRDGGSHYMGESTGDTFDEAVNTLMQGNIYFDPEARTYNGGEIYGNEAGYEDVLNFTRKMADIMVDIEGEFLDNLRMMIQYRFIEQLDECSKGIFFDADIKTAEELEKIVGRCIINNVIVDSVKDILEATQVPDK